MVNESLDLDDVKDVEVVVERRLWGEGDPRRPEHEARCFHDPKRLVDVGAGVPLRQTIPIESGHVVVPKTVTDVKVN